MSIVIFSNEDDQSHSGVRAYDPESDVLFETSRYVGFLDKITNSSENSKNYDVSTINILSGDIDCLEFDKLRINGTQRYGDRYENLVDQISADSYAASLRKLSFCTEISVNLGAVVKNISDIL